MCNFLRKVFILKQFMFHAGDRCQLPPDGPPDGGWSCNWFGGDRICSRICHNGQKVFGINGWWSCSYSDGKWSSWSPLATPSAVDCVGKKQKAIPFFSSV